MPGHFSKWHGQAKTAVLWGMLSVSAGGALTLNSFTQGSQSAPMSPLVTLQAKGTVYDAALDFAASWNAKRNPDGAWKYGWSGGLYGTLVLFPQAGVSPMDNRRQVGWNDPVVDVGYTPSVKLNAGSDDDDGNVSYLAGALILHGGGKDGRDYAHAIWTAPTSGRYSLNVVFEAQQYRINADAHILVSAAGPALDTPVVIHLPGMPTRGAAVSVYDIVLTQNRMTGNYTGNFTMAAGDTIDFAVGQNDVFSLHPGAVSLSAVIQKR